MTLQNVLLMENGIKKGIIVIYDVIPVVDGGLISLTDQSQHSISVTCHTLINHNTPP